ncbi:unnamed protein product, partial [Scytosiphon promiscuus]
NDDAGQTRGGGEKTLRKRGGGRGSGSCRDLPFLCGECKREPSANVHRAPFEQRWDRSKILTTPRRRHNSFKGGYELGIWAGLRGIVRSLKEVSQGHLRRLTLHHGEPLHRLCCGGDESRLWR